jgi:DNA-binding MarR family transcriptional regulator
MSRPDSASSRADVRACATEIFDVVPGVMNVLRSSMRCHIGEGMSTPQFRCLAFIGREPGSSVSGVAAFLGVTLATASAMVDRQVRAGHVQAATSAADRRRSELRITDDGRVLVDRVRAAARRDLGDTLVHASEAELDALLQGLSVLKGLFRRGGVRG